MVRNNEEQLRSQLVSLFRYLLEATRQRHRPTLDVKDYEDVTWFEALRGLDSCSNSLDDPELDCWIELRRVVPPEPPQVPANLEPWLDTDEVRDWRSLPELKPEALIVTEQLDDEGRTDVVEVLVDLENQPDVAAAFHVFADTWLDWAAEREEYQPALDAYSRLFRASQRVEKLGEQFEVLVGAGLLDWPLPARKIRRHLITAPAGIEYDKATGTIRVAPVEMDVSSAPALEHDMVPAEHRPASDVVQSITELLGQSADPLDAESHDAMEHWVLGASAKGNVSRDGEALTPTADAPVVELAPAVVIRRRTQRSLEQTYESILEQLEEGDEIPDAVYDLVEATGGAMSEHDDPWEPSYPPPDGLPAFFPLPANDQQRRIVHELQQRRHVVVQGPPGTGKSHTIANLISHALATGQRVLVTSHTVRALQVLQEKLPEEIRNLTVSVLGSGREGARDLQRSATNLLQRMSDPGWGAQRLDAQLEELESTLDAVQTERAQILARLAREREELTEPSLLESGYEGTLGEIAEQVALQRDERGWLPDQASGPLPLSLEELHELKNLSQDLRSKPALKSAIDPEDLPTPGEFNERVGALTAAQEQLAGLTGDPGTASALLELDLAPIVKALDAYDTALAAARRRSEPWVDAALADLEAGRFHTWLDLRERTAAYLGAIVEHPYESLSIADLERPDLRQLLSQAHVLKTHLADGGKLTQLIGTPKSVKMAEPLLGLLQDQGIVVATAADASHATDLMAEVAALAELEKHWHDRLPAGRSTLAQRRAEMAANLSALQHLEAVVLAMRELDSLAGDALGDPVDTHTDVDELADAVAVVYARSELAEAEEAWKLVADAIADALEGQAADLRERVRVAAEARDDSTYQRAYEEVVAEHRLFARWERMGQLFTSLDAVAPRTAEWVVATDTEADALDALPEAWSWAWAEAQVRALRSESLSDLDERIRILDTQAAELVAELAGLRAWRCALERITPAEATELKAYQAALQALGKGTGKRAATQRAAARRHLDNCQSAVPAWIMPTYRVAETVAATPQSFDLVIVDEASQSGPDAMFLFWLGRQTVIVGDNHQISPSAIGVTADAITALRNNYLDGVPLADHLDFEQSLFDQAKIRFHGEIWLTEHFRCMPEIIEFSNRLVYAPNHRRLEPLKQFGTDRLTPLQRVYVPQGERIGSSSNAVNKTEAQAVVEAIVRCHGDPQYDGLSFGMVSLLGEAHARMVEQLLMERIDPEGWVERDLRCGDAYDFQGDERDVIFMSMVTTLQDGQARIPKLGHRQYEQRYNVAASRARDQAWLFHSMTLDQLHPECVRHELLNHFTQPPVLDVKPLTDVVPDDVLHRPFDSLFEQRVFNEIAGRGYAVEPQFEAYGRRIDLVVAGSGGKLAVECDGSHWHGPEQFAADLDRQQALERAGWRFFRVTDTDFYLDRESALEPLWAMLRGAGIHPMGEGGDSHRALDVSVAEPIPVVDEAEPLAGGRTPGPSAEDAPREDPAELPAGPVESMPRPTSSPVARAEAAVPKPPAEREPGAHFSPSEAPATQLSDISRPSDEPTHAGDGGLARYPAWEHRQLRDPTLIPRRELADALEELVSTEGPVVAERAFQEVNLAAGNRRLGKNIRTAMLDALQDLVRSGRVTQSDPLGAGDPLRSTLSRPGQVAAPRELGPRGSFDHVPPEELAGALRLPAVRSSHGSARLRAVLDLYGLKRLTAGVEERLEACLRLDSGQSHTDAESEL